MSGVTSPVEAPPFPPKSQRPCTSVRRSQIGRGLPCAPFDSLRTGRCYRVLPQGTTVPEGSPQRNRNVTESTSSKSLLYFNSLFVNVFLFMAQHLHLITARTRTANETSGAKTKTKKSRKHPPTKTSLGCANRAFWVPGFFERAQSRCEWCCQTRTAVKASIWHIEKTRAC